MVVMGVSGAGKTMVGRGLAVALDGVFIDGDDLHTDEARARMRSGQALTDEDRRTIVRWIDLGCPIDLDYDPAKPQAAGYGWMLDDNRPTLTLTFPKAGVNESLTRLLVGMHDYDTGLDMASFTVTADFPIDDVPAGQNLAAKFKPKTPGVWELTLNKPVVQLPRGKLIVAVLPVRLRERRAFAVNAARRARVAVTAAAPWASSAASDR